MPAIVVPPLWRPPTQGPSLALRLAPPVLLSMGRQEACDANALIPSCAPLGICAAPMLLAREDSTAWMLRMMSKAAVDVSRSMITAMIRAVRIALPFSVSVSRCASEADALSNLADMALSGPPMAGRASPSPNSSTTTRSVMRAFLLPSERHLMLPNFGFVLDFSH